MKIIIDADGCPVVRQAVKAAGEKGLQTILVFDTAHEFRDVPGAECITVDKGADSADYKIANLAVNGDIVLTQDYGLAAMCLSRGCLCIDQNGRIYNDDNIGALLEARGFAAKYRRSGGRLKGPKKREKSADEAFLAAIKKLMEDNCGRDQKGNIQAFQGE